MKTSLQSLQLTSTLFFRILDFRKSTVFKRQHQNIIKPISLLFLLLFLCGNSQTTTAFSFTGANQTFTVPVGVTSISVKIWGSGGGNASQGFFGGSGGSGGYIQGILTVTPGTILNIAVGGGGKFASNTVSGNGYIGGAGGWPGGGNGGNSTGNNSGNGAGGGGYTGVFTSVTYSTANALVVAAGGGGGAGRSSVGPIYPSGGGAGTSGWNTLNSQLQSGGSGLVGILTAGGAGGTGNTDNGIPGGALTGGNGASVNNYSAGGGGGGGYYGGGGGGGNNTGGDATQRNKPSGGGGGGFSFVTNPNFTLTTNTFGNSGTSGALFNPPNVGDANYAAGIGVGQSGSANVLANGGDGRVVFTYTSCTAPTTQATIGAYTNNTSGTGLTVNWTRGNGNNVIVVGRLTATTLVNPTSGTNYTANSAFGTAGSTTGSGNFVVYNGPLTTVNVTGLTNNSNYTFTVYEYNTTATCYNTAGSSSPVTTTLVVAAPTVTSFTPSSRCANSGAKVVITGTNFTGATAVAIGGTAPTTFTVDSATQITATVGTGATGKIAVTTAAGTATSTATFTVDLLPSITTQPAGTSICTIGSGTFTVSSNGTSFQWRRNNTPLTNSGIYSGVNTATLTITNPTLGEAGNFDVVVSNANCSVTSENKVLTVNTVPQIVTGPLPANGATGICYEGTGAVSSISWGASTGATSYDVYFGAGSLPGTPTANITGGTSYNTGKLLPNKTYYWKIVAKNACGSSASSDTFTFTTTTLPCYCIASVGSGFQSQNYINSVAIRGTLVEAENLNSSFSSSPLGYQDFTAKLPRAKQTQGGAVNVVMESTQETYYKAWVDYDNNGSFEDGGEKVYDAGTTQQLSTTFGFVIPANQPPGLYRLRIRISDGSTFTSCGNIDGSGETEDYLIEVVANCWSIINNITDNTGCAGKTVDLKANASGTVVEYRWYDQETGGSLQGTSLPVSTPTNNATTWTTSVLSATTVYYVEAWSGTCSSLVRVPVRAFIKPIPLINFNLPSATACGDNSIITLSASGNNQTTWLIDDNFEKNDTDLGSFTEGRENSIDAGGVLDTKAKWKNKESVFVANAGVSWTPAISSGAQSDNFVMTTSDLGAKYNVNTTLTSVAKSTVGFTSLRLKFKMYYSRYQPDGLQLAKDFVKVQASINGTTWNDIDVITKDIGTATKFDYPIKNATNSYDLSSYIGNPNFQIRILYHADDWCDGVAIDDVELYGVEPLKTSFTWSSTNPIKFYSDSQATIDYVENTEATVVYIKPDATQIAAYNDWNITATVNLSNGCPATGSFSVINDTKVWMPSSTLMTNWNDSNTWKPSTAIPDLTKCVVIRKPVIIGAGINAQAKNIKIETGGEVTVNGSLKVDNEINNTLTAANFVVSSDANLVQVNETAINTGNITVKRDSQMRKNNYTYWSSPVSAQNLYGFSTGTSTTRFYYYRESDDKFYNDTFNATTIFNPTQGYAIMAPSTYTGLQTFTGSFLGVPNNGIKKVDNTTLQFPLKLSSEIPADDKGYNLIGNPYPSNIDFDKLFTENGGSTTDQNSTAGRIFRVAYFWTNVNPNRQGSTNGTGSGYSGNAYAVYNGTGGLQATSETNSLVGFKPTNIIKVGQGFIVKARPGQNNTNLIFNNTIRTIATTNFFSKGSAPEKDRYWLKLTTPALDVNTILIGYVPGATNGFEWDYDAPLLSVGSDSFYSLLNEDKLGIQGRTYPLNKQDIVTLGTKHFDGGNYTISLGDREGIFAADQNIYLKDKQTGIITNLSEGSYTFATNIGESSTRFEIIYKPETVLATDSNVKEDLVIYRKDNDFVVKSLNKKITTLDVYDITGRLIYSAQPTSTEAVIPAEKLINNVYVLKIDRNGKISTKKILK